MNDYILLMYQAPEPISLDWPAYFSRLRRSGQFSGGSSIGSGLRLSKSGAAEQSATPLVGYIRVTADSLEDAQSLLAGNPVYEAGGVVEIRELPKSE